ncbi:MAG: nucleoside deaminase [Bacteroidaceae bacterium]|nr:nucleoside deaminase [Prevotellaceae bacterium]MDY5632783.1 nucleoside deaminase [Bacteroidaceae bacterium]
MEPNQFMQMAIDLAKENIKNGGGPFGAVIVKDGEIVATGVNRVTSNQDPTAHAEVQAIRAACQKLNTFVLAGCEIYSSCEPCPMCLGAIYWSRMSKLYFAASKDDAASVDFSDAFIYQELDLEPSQRSLATRVMMAKEGAQVFDLWREQTDKIEY